MKSCCLLVAFCVAVIVPASASVSLLRDGIYAANKPTKLGDIWSDCSKSGDAVKINSVKIDPDPPKIGENVTITANITTSKDIVEGDEVVVEVKVDFIPVKKTLDTCDTLKQVNLSCPLKPGTYRVTIRTTLPKDAPKGHYKGTVVGKDKDGNEMFCISIDAHLK